MTIAKTIAQQDYRQVLPNVATFAASDTKCCTRPLLKASLPSRQRSPLCMLLTVYCHTDPKYKNISTLHNAQCAIIAHSCFHGRWNGHMVHVFDDTWETLPEAQRTQGIESITKIIPTPEACWVDIVDMVCTLWPLNYFWVFYKSQEVVFLVFVSPYFS